MFDINSTTGVVTFVSPPDYESASITYTFLATFTDDKGNISTQ
ncbi:MAG: hypothetical protein Q9M36_03565 [Sulfurovum sp.]|nr:hypothetical protein [Sulfurovum sp.]